MSGISSILSMRSGGRPAPVRAYIIPLDVYNHDKPVLADKFYFQYFPENVTVFKAVNWQIKDIPGMSHPLYQWISGGAREISFTAVFSRDRELTTSERRVVTDTEISDGTNQLSELEPAFADPKGFSDPRNVDIPSAVALLRSFMYPNYADGYLSEKRFSTEQSRPKPPCKMILGLPGLRLGMGSLQGNAGDEVNVIMLSCEESYEAFFSDGSPRICRVALSFAEIIQVDNKVSFGEAGALRNAGRVGYRLKFGHQDKKR